MAHFAKIENNIVTEVIVADRAIINSGLFGDISSWVQTSYNTRGNVHYGADGQPDGGLALRGNYAGIGYTYDEVNDVFYAPKPYASWNLNETTWLWEAPTPMPTGTQPYIWNEETQSWIAS